MHFLAPNSFHDSLICKTIYWEIEISSLDKRILKDLELDRFEDIFRYIFELGIKTTAVKNRDLGKCS